MTHQRLRACCREPPSSRILARRQALRHDPPTRVVPLVRIAPVVLLCAVAGCGSAPEPRAADARQDSTVIPPSSPVADTTSAFPPCPQSSCRAPAEVAGDYVLVEMDGQPLPYTSHFDDESEPRRRCTSIIEDQVVRLRADGSFQQSGRGRIWCSDMRRPDAPSRDTLAGTWSLHGPRADSVSMRIPAIDPPAELAGVVDGDELRVIDVSDWHTAGRTARYLRRRP